MRYLRSLRSSDLQFLEAIENNPDFMKYGAFHLPFTRAQLSEFIKNSHQNIRKSSQYRYVIEYREKAVGFLDLFDYKPKLNLAFVGIIVIPSHRKMNVAYESLLELETLCKRDWGIRLLRAQVASDNLPSLQLFKKLKYKKLQNTDTSISSSTNKALFLFEKALI
ncbi:MAG: GNAT family N-acetyltransferase [Flavobacteriaceae bacterium]|nr:GNAT family N-acetyltransferase [Flavobacteriaceae bacterium]MCI5088284.1 GNAT family N-acetyltransferase [Flavobacteriaceae bacterium]